MIRRLVVMAAIVACVCPQGLWAFPQWTNAGAGSNWNTAANWADDAFPAIMFVPTAGDLAIHDNLGGTMTLADVNINANATADSFRLSNGAGAVQNSGDVLIEYRFLRPDFTVATDNGLWVGEFGDRTFNGPSTQSQCLYNERRDHHG